MALTALDKKIERLEKDIKRAKAQRFVAVQKERNGQLIIAGLMVERLYKKSTPEKRESLKKMAAELLFEKQGQERMRKMFDRLDIALGETGGEGNDEIEGES